MAKIQPTSNPSLDVTGEKMGVLSAIVVEQANLISQMNAPAKVYVGNVGPVTDLTALDDFFGKKPASDNLLIKEVLLNSAAGLEKSRNEVAKIRGQEPQWLPNLFNKVF